MKHCKACGLEKPTTEFHKDRSKTDGLNFYCKPCARERTNRFASRPPRVQTAPEGFKRCPRCEQRKPLEEFHASQNSFDGKAKVCKQCSYTKHAHWRKHNLNYAAEQAKKWRTANPERSADHSLKKTYGLPLGTYRTMLEAQGGVCAICAATKVGGKGGRFHVDHCHSSGRIRGLLCNDCNHGLAKFKDSAGLLSSAITYLTKGQAERRG